MPDLPSVIERSISQSVQTTSTADVGNVWVVNWLARAGLSMPGWWSFARDNELRRFWKESDHLAGAIYTLESRMASIPFKVIPENRSDRKAVSNASMLTDILASAVEYGTGWVDMYSMWVEDLLSTDNGGFLEVIGGGNKNGPIIGPATSLAHLDSSRCTRTGDPIFPVIFEGDNGKRYKLHYTRVIYASQMPSPIKEMNKVGFSAVSRVINVAQTLIDILVYKQEKLGSRPHRQIIITKGGLDPEDLKSAFSIAESSMDSRGLTRFSKVVVGGSSAIPEAGLDIVELSSLPDGFDEQTSITLGMATIALGFGVDARELFPALSSGATRADALLQHLKQRGKGPGQILQITENALDYKFLPDGYTISFDFQDDAEDRQRAEIRKIRADRRVQDMSTGAIPERVLREQMVEDGEVSREQFERMEVESGRLPNGTSVLTLFYAKRNPYKKLLNVGTQDPLDVSTNDKDSMIDAIKDKRMESNEILANSDDEQEIWDARVALSALNRLEVLYVGPPPIGVEEDVTVGASSQSIAIEERIRSQDLTSPTEGDQEFTTDVNSSLNMPGEETQSPDE